MTVLATFADEELWTGESMIDALESSHIVYFPRTPVALPDEATLRYLRSELPLELKRKNISYHPEAGRLTGLKADAATTQRLRAILEQHLGNVAAFLQAHLAPLCEDWTVGTCSIRPIQERGRNLKPHASNELIHVDAGAYGATDGDRILRFFVNFSDHEDRVWATKGPIGRILERHGREARSASRRIPPGWCSRTASATPACPAAMPS